MYMDRINCRLFAVLATVVIGVGSLFGELGLGIGFAIACVMSISAIVSGLRRHKPSHGGVWLLLASSLGLFLLGGIVAELTADTSESAVAPYPGWQEPFDLAAYAAAFAALWAMGRARQVHRDRTITLDALITVMGVGSLSWVMIMSEYLESTDLTSWGKATGVAFSLITLALGFGTIRLAIGPGARPPAYYLLAGGAAGGLIAELLVEIDLLGRSPLGVSGVWSIVASATSFVLVGMAALHPSMTELTEAPPDPTPIVTARRLALMALAVLIPPGLLMIEEMHSDGFDVRILIGLWAFTSMIVMARIAALALARERVTQLDGVVSAAEAGFVTAPTDDELVRIVLDSVGEIVPRLQGTAFHQWIDDEWRLIDHSGAGVSGVLDSRPRPTTAGPAETNDPIWQLDLHIDGAGRPPSVVSVAAVHEPSMMHKARLVDLVSSMAQAAEATLLRELMSRDKFERRFRVLVENSADIIFVLDDEGVTRFVTSAGPRLLGFTEAELLGMSFESLITSEVDQSLDALVRGASTESLQLELRCSDDTLRWFEVRSADMSDEPEVAGVVITASEITAQKEAEFGLRRSEARFRSLVKHASDLVAILDSEGRISWLSPSVSEVLGFDQVAIADSLLGNLVHTDDRSTLAERLIAVSPGTGAEGPFELRVRNVGDRWLTLVCTLTDLRDDPSVDGVVLNAHDITERKRLEETLRHQVLHDDLTGVPNRVLFRTHIRQALETSGIEVAAVVVLDLDDFKTVNDGLGHSTGDEVLKVTAARLQRHLRASDSAARLGGDEFAVLLTGDHSRAKALATCNRILHTMQQPIEIDGRQIVLSASAGIAFSDDLPHADPETMLRSADVAMYGAKNRGKGRVTVFDQSMHQGAFDRLDLKADLAVAAERNELEMHYQPFIDMATGSVTGFEALMRWNHPVRGTISPGTFIPLAEETGLIVPIGRWLMDVAFTQLNTWQSLDPSMAGLSMSVNLSGRQLEDIDIVDDIARAIQQSGVDPTTVVIELTESIAVEESPALVEKLNRIRALGVGLHADDFGAGYASYAALQSLPFTGVKIDRSLVSGLDGSTPERARVQIRSIIDMAAGTGMGVIAEGIETIAQVKALSALHCDTAQGFYFARPAPFDAAADPLHAAIRSGHPPFADHLSLRITTSR